MLLMAAMHAAGGASVAHYLSQRLNGLGRHRARKLGNIERAPPMS
jgi:hypothetical protein